MKLGTNETKTKTLHITTMTTKDKKEVNLLNRQFIVLYGPNYEQRIKDIYTITQYEDTERFLIVWHTMLNGANHRNVSVVYTKEDILKEMRTQNKREEHAVWAMLLTPSQKQMLEDMKDEYITPKIYLIRKPFPYYFYWERSNLNKLRKLYLERK